MAHEIVNQQIAYTGELPWHGIGAEMDPDAPAEEWLKAANLDWSIEKLPLKAYREDGTEVKVPNRSAFVRSTDNKVMTIAGNDWVPLQNADTIAFMDRYVRAGGAKLETIGALRDGLIVWGLASLNHDFEVTPGDKVKGYLLITASHIVGTANRLRTTTVRVVCANTMRLADANSNSHYSQNHRREFDVEAAKAAVEAAHEGLAMAEKRAKTIDKLKLSLEDSVKKVIVPVFIPNIANSEIFDRIMDPDVMPRQLAAIVDSIQNAPGAKKNNGWGTLNGVTHYCDHIGGRGAATRMRRSWLGDYGDMKLKAEGLLLDLAA